METSAIIARAVAPIAGTIIGSIFLLAAGELPLSRSDTAAAMFMYSVLFAIFSGIYALWDVIAARIFAIATSVLFFGLLAETLVAMIERSWSRIYPEHLVLMCCYVLIGLASPLLSLAAVQIVKKQFARAENTDRTGATG